MPTAPAARLESLCQSVFPSRLIDMHTHVWSDADGMSPRESNFADLTAMADRYGIESLVVLPLFGGKFPTIEQVRAGNDVVADWAKRESRVIPFVTLFPRHGRDAEAELERGLGDLGARGLKIWVSPADEPAMFPLIERMIEAGKPTLIHAMHKTVGQYELESDPVQVAHLARRYPEATIIMAHSGGNFLYGCEAIRDCPNVVTDISGTYCEQGMTEFAVETLGPERVLFGSDAPGVEFLSNLAKVMAADLDDPTKDTIMYRNSKRLFP